MKQYIDKADVMSEIEKLQLCTMDEDGNFYSPEAQGEYNALCKLESFIDTLEAKEVEEEPVSNTTLLYGLSGSVGIEEAVRETEEYREWQGDPERQQSFIDFAKFGANYKHYTSKDLD